MMLLKLRLPTGYFLLLLPLLLLPLPLPLLACAVGLLDGRGLRGTGFRACFRGDLQQADKGTL